MHASVLFWSVLIAAMTILGILLSWALYYRRRKSNLLNACYFGDSENAKRLLALGADVNMNATSRLKPTPLAMAATRNDEELVRMLLDHGADVNSGQSTIKPLGEACRSGLHVGGSLAPSARGRPQCARSARDDAAHDDQLPGNCGHPRGARREP